MFGIRVMGYYDTIGVYGARSPDKKRKYILRIHHPISRVFTGWQEKEVIESELQWLLALRRDTDIAVEEPIPNQQGSRYRKSLENVPFVLDLD